MQTGFSLRVLRALRGEAFYAPRSISADSSLFNPLLVHRPTDDVPDEDTWGDDVVGIDLSGFDQLLDLGDRDASGACHHRIEIARRPPIHEVADPIALPGFHEREVGRERPLEHVRLAVDDACLLP